MNLKRVCEKGIYGIIAIVVMSAFGGPNEDAQIVVDHDALTEKIEAACLYAGDEVFIAIKARGVNDLAGFCITVEYDAAQLKFVSAKMTMEGSSGHSFLESEGGQSGPFMVIPKDGKVEVVAGIKANSGEEAPDGDGTLAYLKFERLDTQESTITITKAELSDYNLTIDKIITE